jgi:mRNA interferase MazF
LIALVRGAQVYGVTPLPRLFLYRWQREPTFRTPATSCGWIFRRRLAERRPAVVLSRRIYNEKANRAVVGPLTSHAKGYPFEVALPAGSRFRGAILADQMKSLDWRPHEAQKAGKIPAETLEQVPKRMGTLIGIS